MTRYGAFGYCLSVPDSLPLYLPPPGADTRGEIRIEFGSCRQWVSHCSGTFPERIGRVGYGLFVLDGESYICIDIPDVARYTLHERQRILIDPYYPTRLSEIALYLTGFVLSFVAHSPGSLVFHGSAVCGTSGAQLLLGAQGAGKSTTAAALSLHGYRVICDDSIPVEICSGSLVAYAGIPRPKLLPDAIGKLFPHKDKSFFAWDGVDKYHVDVEPGPSSASVSGIIVLEPADNTFLFTEVRGAKKVAALKTHLQLLRGIDDAGQSLSALISVASAVPVRRLIRPAGQECLDRVVAAVSGVLDAPMEEVRT